MTTFRIWFHISFFPSRRSGPTPRTPNDPGRFRSVGNRSRLLRELRVTLLERVDAALGIDHRLLPSEVGVASGAGVDRHLLLGGTGLDDVAARAGDRGVAVSRMDVFLHGSSFPLRNCERILYPFCPEMARGCVQ